MLKRRYQLFLSGNNGVQASGRIYAVPRSTNDEPVFRNRISVRSTVASRVMLLEPGAYHYEFNSSGSGAFGLQAFDVGREAITKSTTTFAAPGIVDVFRFRVLQGES